MQNILPFLKRGEVRRSITRFIKESKYLRYIRLFQPESRLWFRGKGTLPDFLLIGAQRSGSTFLNDYLNENTTAKGSPIQKEVHYFDNKFYKSVGWYSRFFEDLSSEGDSVKNFESSPYYLYHPAVPVRIKDCLPNIKAIAVLRDPVARSVSQYRWMRQVDLEARGPVEAFQYDAERIDRETDREYLEKFEDPLYFDFDHIHYGYIRRSLYHVQIQRWLEHFNPDNIRIISSSRLFDETEEVLERLSEFLGIEHHTPGRVEKVKQNASDRNITVPPEARDIAENHLKDVEDKVRNVVCRDMIIGGELSFQ